jgi:hypothetical protein
MDIFTFSEGLHDQLKAMAESTRSKEQLAHASGMINLVKELLHDLQQFTHNYTFNDTQEEIRFFKETKPVLLSQYFYYRKLFDIALFDSYKDPQRKKTFYESELLKMEQFARKQDEFFRYCMSGDTYFDDVYFTRKEKLLSGLIDTRFSTGYDEKLARLLANELIRKTLLDMMVSLNANTSFHSPVNWTGNKTDAIELLIALHASGNFNNGDAEVKQVVKTFEEYFNISLGNYYDLLKKIRMRKGNRSNFLDVLKEKFLQRLDQMEG